MSANHHKDSAKDLWNYFETVINWVEKTFVKKRKFMRTGELDASNKVFQNTVFGYLQV